jgi:hypothetical protein
MATKTQRNRKHIPERFFSSEPITTEEYDLAVRAMIVSLVKLVSLGKSRGVDDLPAKYKKYLSYLNDVIYSERRLVFRYKLWAMQIVLEGHYHKNASKAELKNFAGFLVKEFQVNQELANELIVVSREVVSSRANGHSGGPKNYSEEVIATLMLDGFGMKVTQKLIKEVIADSRQYNELREELLTPEENTRLLQFASTLLGPKGTQQLFSPP